ncbi:hypothetical protein POM88_000251 [Heracleum sosnowskyi]|uniref:Uncharacterized protein n=1 Tax=Heracleum sosnowskyi TaxID=360622 RepID=A0AAD8JDK2_9APIA|nr:hypothetical protein POM88_000251 [Heracleum sosnowskyi]
MANYMPIGIHVLLCLVLLSSHACNARPFGSQLSCKKNEDCSMNKSVFPAAQPISSRELVEAEENSMQRLTTKGYSKKLEFSLDYDPPKTHPPPPPHDPPVHNDLQAESHVSVAWPVPHKKIGEKQSQFNLDYDPPRTHPPVHN